LKLIEDDQKYKNEGNLCFFSKIKGYRVKGIFAKEFFEYLVIENPDFFV